MAAVLEKNRADGKPMVLPDRMEHSEPIQCSGCSVSYTLAYGATEHRIQNGQNVVEVMCRTARELVSATHPTHEVEMYVWGGLYKGWLDREEATAAGL